MSAEALASARFRVTGFCVFDPAAPLDPAAEVPDTRAEIDALHARHEFLYRYPPE